MQKVEATVAVGSPRLCRQSGPISEAEAQTLVDVADELRARSRALKALSDAAAAA